MDGNFTADHMKMRRPEDDVHLMHGFGYMVEEERYQQHLSRSMELKQVLLSPHIEPPLKSDHPIFPSGLHVTTTGQ